MVFFVPLMWTMVQFFYYIPVRVAHRAYSCTFSQHFLIVFGKERADRGQTEGRQRADRGQTEGRQLADRGQTEGRQRADRGQTEGRQRVDRG